MGATPRICDRNYWYVILQCVRRTSVLQVWPVVSDIDAERFTHVGHECMPLYIEAIRAKDDSPVSETSSHSLFSHQYGAMFLACTLLLASIIVDDTNVL
jgi:hypothetical protein